jgi:uncharacterized membrane protein YfcA
MDAILDLIPLHLLVAAGAVAFFAGVIKGIVGFAMPMIIMSGLSTFVSPELALAGLLAPTVVTNGMQILRYGLNAVRRTVAQFRVFLAVAAVMILSSAQIVPLMSPQVYLLAIGVAVTCFAIWQLSGFAPEPGSLSQGGWHDGVIGTVTGFIGGISGMWGPPTVAYLTAIGTEKREQMLAQGVIYGLGAVMLVIAHIGSGILNAQTLPLSLGLVPPAMIGMWIGGQISDRFDQKTFRKVTLLVLIIGGLNLLRRGIMG